jgi:hypothetical protein
MQQLELFRTPEQEERLNNAISAFEKRQASQMADFFAVKRVLKENNFIEGKHYEIDGTAEFIDGEKTFDCGRWNETIEETVPVKYWDGAIRFIWQDYSEYDNELKVRKTTAFMEDGKFNVPSLQGNYRKIKASTMRDRLDESWTRSQAQYDRFLKQEKNTMDAVKQLKADFPNAEVKRYGGYDSDRTIMITFPNGNYAIYEVFSNGDLFHKRTYIATVMNLDGNDRLRMLESL